MVSPTLHRFFVLFKYHTSLAIALISVTGTESRGPRRLIRPKPLRKQRLHITLDRHRLRLRLHLCLPQRPANSIDRDDILNRPLLVLPVALPNLLQALEQRAQHLRDPLGVEGVAPSGQFVHLSGDVEFLQMDCGPQRAEDLSKGVWVSSELVPDVAQFFDGLGTNEFEEVVEALDALEREGVDTAKDGVG